MIRELVQRNRSYRRFYEEVRIELETLRELVNLARLSASGGNRQPLKYFLSVESNTNEKIFRTLTWAVYLKNWRGPAEGERPAAYIIVLGDTRIAASVGCDHGIACQSILLGAVERGLGGCIVGSIKRNELRGVLNIPEDLEILLTIALGKPKDSVVLEPLGPDGDFRYWRDESGVHHVPKRSLDDLIIGTSEG
ncbi:MAG TPA: nitroreductase family protein [Syntrophobacteria bacterium]|nr:nitroreductase family protein [Syntrophobacteria bacterium]